MMTVAPLPILPILTCYIYDRLRKGHITWPPWRYKSLLPSPQEAVKLLPPS